MSAEIQPEHHVADPPNVSPTREAIEQDMFWSFYNYCRDRKDVDPATADTEQGLAVATAMHEFLGFAVQGMIERRSAANPRQVYPSPPTTPGRLTEFYVQYGYYGHGDNLQQSRRTDHLATYEALGWRYRHMYPEAGLTQTLTRLFLEKNWLVAADSARAVQAAIGASLEGRIIGGIAVRAEE